MKIHLNLSTAALSLFHNGQYRELEEKKMAKGKLIVSLSIPCSLQEWLKRRMDKSFSKKLLNCKSLFWLTQAAHSLTLKNLGMETLKILCTYFLCFYNQCFHPWPKIELKIGYREGVRAERGRRRKIGIFTIYYNAQI